MIQAGVMLFFIGIIIMICYPINKKKNTRCTAQTQGILTNIRRRVSTKGPRKSIHVYSYQVDGTEYHLETVEHSPEVSDVGDACTIWYNPRKPKDAQAYRPSDKYLKILLYVGLGLFLLGIILIVMPFIQLFIL